MWSEEADFEHLAARAGRLAIRQARPVGQAQHPGPVAAHDVVDPEQRGDLDAGADLLPALPHSGSLGMLVVVDEASR